MKTPEASPWVTLHTRGPALDARPPQLVIAPATLEDIRPLLNYHYRQQPLTCCCKVLGAWLDRQLVGGLIVTHASLNGQHRTLAWPTWPTHLSKKAHAQFVNHHLRRIARVVVIPALRGQGVATRLVRAYLDDPLTPLTETIAAMGQHAPVFLAAGMRRVDVPDSKQQARIRAVLDAHGIIPWRLMDEPYLMRATQRDALINACRSWARASCVTRSIVEASPQELLRACAWRASTRGAVFVKGEIAD
jgi:GNAT superfamily N-acetyltransferase